MDVSSIALAQALIGIHAFGLQIVKKAQQGAGVAVKIEHAAYQSAKMFGRHFDESDELYSHITRASIDILKVCKVFC